MRLESAQTAQVEAVLSLVVNELVGLDYRFCHVFDDYQQIENPAIDSSLAFLIEHLPQNVNLVISSRRDPGLPLARWRARQQMAEIRSADLRFTMEESTDFLNRSMELDLSEPEIDALGTRTEGWIAGLQLAALSIKDHFDRAAFIKAFTGSHRFIIDYLVEEVLSQQSAPVREFLLSTSILDRLCAPLCDALVGTFEGWNVNTLSPPDHEEPAHSSEQRSNVLAFERSDEILEFLERANLFIIPLDNERRWYRYHHLFSDVLKARLRQQQPELHAKMHRQASDWFEREGFIDQAFQHALAAPDLERAAGLVERNSMNMILRSEVLLIRSWLEKLPDEMVQTRPGLILANGWILVLTGRGQALEPWLAAPGASAALAAADLPDGVRGELALLRATLARFRREADLSLELAHQALELLSDDERGLQAGAMYTIGTVNLQKGEIASASSAFNQAVLLGEAKGGPYMALISLQELSEIQIRQGKLTQAVKTSQQAVSMAARWGWQDLPAAGMAHIYLGQAFYQRNDLAEAIRELAEGVDLLQGSIEQFVLAQGFASLAQAQHAIGNTAGALATIQRGKDWFKQMQVEDTGAGTLLDLGENRLRLLQGDLRAAIQWSQGSHWKDEGTTTGYLQAVTLIRLRLAQHRQKMEDGFFQEGLNTTNRLLAAAESKGWWGDVLELSLLRALLCQAQGDREGALSNLERGLTLSEPEGHVRLFVDEGESMRVLLLDYQKIIQKKIGEEMDDRSLRFLAYTDKLLDAFTLPVPVEKTMQETLLEALSERELAILRLIATGRSNQEIAEILVIAVSTVKSHINHLYGKLGTQRRTQAISIARDLGLLG
jgi:LuxR family maltose regulon positive regulatory protein